MVLGFARAGARVAFTWSRREGDAEETLRLLAAEGAEALSFRGSVTDAAHARATVDAVVGAWGGLDVLVCNASVTRVLPIALLEEADWDEVMDTNVKGAYLFSRAALRPMIRARKGHLLMVGSVAGDRVMASPVHFAASKAALVGFARALAREVGRHGIAVNVLSPGLLDEGLSRRLPEHRLREYVEHCALGRLGTVDEVAEVATWLVSGENTFMSGSRVDLDGGL